MSEREVTVTITANVRPFTEALRKAGESAGKFAHAMRVTFWSAERRRKHHARCRYCNPRGNPRPLCIDGHAYHRRKRRRKRR